MLENSDSSVKLFSYQEDQPVNGKGTLIPRRGDWRPKRNLRSYVDVDILSRNLSRAGFSLVAIIAGAILGTSSYGLLTEANMSAAPIVTVIDPETKVSAVLEYGEQKAFLGGSFFAETRDAFIREAVTFIEIDLETRQLRFFRDGTLVQNTEILSQGDASSWWSIPAGLYKVQKLDKNLFHTNGQAYLPWLITFQGNYLIHGWPKYPDGSSVKEDFTAGGIRLDNENAELLYGEVEVGTPVLVYAVKKPRVDNFVYEPKVSGLTTEHYYVADMTNGSVLASSKFTEPAPIASLTKLMTAVVAAEKISLDARVLVTSPTFVTSLIPRLAERGSVSMYSLLKLLLVESSNEAGETIAGEVGREDFIKSMNDKARQIGLMKTNFSDPAGLNNDNISTIEDLYLLTKYIYENKRFILDITANKALGGAHVEGEFSNLVNFNEINGTESFIGGKVGETEMAGQTSISLHKMNLQGEERVLVLILLGSKDRTKDVGTLVSHVMKNYDN